MDGKPYTVKALAKHYNDDDYIDGGVGVVHLKLEVLDWFNERDLQAPRDWKIVIPSDWWPVFQFKDQDMAVLFKLTWG